ncbi:hypothetical protein BOTBODRAFT_431970 [Botryobasidium botryosum FD-172 SS1]|uniref:Uncharacterized protein n=1 Tax=Botryobasidium botryosum (strain FD-172 SS1) TaxID=930990 RepID=A0A067MK17_BOTB1|nr:hypothetical protein BOTBODRAFT_431970 [Botryobasidium botryosum FD-172 SS1]
MFSQEKRPNSEESRVSRNPFLSPQFSASSTPNLDGNRDDRISMHSSSSAYPECPPPPYVPPSGTRRLSQSSNPFAAGPSSGSYEPARSLDVTRARPTSDRKQSPTPPMAERGYFLSQSYPSLSFNPPSGPPPSHYAPSHYSPSPYPPHPYPPSPATPSSYPPSPYPSSPYPTQTYTPSSYGQPNAVNAVPILLPQRRPGDVHRGFVMAYPPVLASAGIDAPTWFEFMEAYNKSLQVSSSVRAVQAGTAVAGLIPLAGLQVLSKPPIWPLRVYAGR